jgi:uncharacterized surface protein with fasciclin (FAS1) repeats
MRKLVTVVFALLAFAAVPAFAQEEAGTIADVVVASTEAETPEFSILLAAVSAADPAFLETLSNADANVTVFAPTDAAFGALLEELGMTAEEVLGNAELLNSVLAYHVVPGAFNAEAVVALDGALLGTMLADAPLMISAADGSVMVNDATVVTADVAASNGVVHVIDRVLLPPMDGEAMASEEAPMTEPAGSIADLVVASTEAETPEFATLLAAVSAADPSILDTLTNGGPYTVFAPTDAAFAGLLESMSTTAEELLANTELLNTVLAYHVVPGIFSAETVAGAVGSAEAGVNVATLLPGAFVTLTAGDETVRVNDANIIATDVLATNGVVHVIDTVILPPMQ